MAAEMAHNLGYWVDRGGEKISKHMRDLVADGRSFSATRYLGAIDGQSPLRDALEQLFQQQCNAIITPAAAGVAPKGTATGNPTFCTLWTYLGLPAIAVPLMTGEGGMPLGVQLVGAPGDDARLLRTAQWLVSKLAGAK
jgi:Asp-tRNA(Asn)/Glu-tRNA(Gln) amidotransferase A subunit family amidase